MRLEFVKTPSGDTVDRRPTANGGHALVFRYGSWVLFKGNIGDLLDGIQISKEKTKEITGVIEIGG